MFWKFSHIAHSCSVAVHKNKHKTRQTVNAFGTDKNETEQKYICIKMNPYYRFPVWAVWVRVWISEPNQRHCFSRINFISWMNGISISLVDVFDFFCSASSLLSTRSPMFSRTYYLFWIWVFNLSNVKSGNFQFKVLFCHCIVVSSKYEKKKNVARPIKNWANSLSSVIRNGHAVSLT